MPFFGGTPWTMIEGWLQKYDLRCRYRPEKTREYDPSNCFAVTAYNAEKPTDSLNVSDFWFRDYPTVCKMIKSRKYELQMKATNAIGGVSARFFGVFDKKVHFQYIGTRVKGALAALEGALVKYQKEP